jgi:hypothetical protein
MMVFGALGFLLGILVGAAIYSVLGTKALCDATESLRKVIEVQRDTLDSHHKAIDLLCGRVERLERMKQDVIYR